MNPFEGIATAFVSALVFTSLLFGAIGFACGRFSPSCANVRGVIHDMTAPEKQP
jgi:hypothetical protein